MAQSDEFLRIDTPENVAFDYEVVGIGTRFMAGLIDSLLIALALMVVNLASFLLTVNWLNLAGSWVAALAGLFSFAISWGYYLFFESYWNGQTPGKRRLHIRVVRRDGAPITLIESLVRNLVRIVDFLPFGYGVGIITMFVHPHSCRLGDLAAGTLVVREQSDVALEQLDEGPLSPPFRASSGPPLPEQWPVEHLNSADIQLAVDFLQRRHGLTNPGPLGLRIARRLLVKMQMNDLALVESDAAYLLAMVVKAYRQPEEAVVDRLG